MNGKQPIYEVGAFRLDPDEKLLRRGDGEVVAISPKAFDLLVFLVENHGCLLTKAKIFEEVWPDCFVEDGNLKINIQTLRQILPLEFFEKVPKRGYRFFGGVRVDDASSSLQSASFPEEENRVDDTVPTARLNPTVELTVDAAGSVAGSFSWEHRKSVLVAVTTTFFLNSAMGEFYLANHRDGRAFSTPAIERAAARSIAVLPFRNLTRDQQDEFPGIGLTDAFIPRLGSLDNNSVRPTVAVMTMGEDANHQLLSEQLQVGIILTGTVLRKNDRIRVGAQL